LAKVNLTVPGRSFGGSQPGTPSSAVVISAEKMTPKQLARSEEKRKKVEALAVNKSQSRMTRSRKNRERRDKLIDHLLRTPTPEEPRVLVDLGEHDQDDEQDERMRLLEDINKR